jgi:hypothetical protein
MILLLFFVSWGLWISDLVKGFCEIKESHNKRMQTSLPKSAPIDGG